MFIKILGAGREVGRNAILIKDGEAILLDYGINVETGEMPKLAKNPDAIFLSHAHLDHSGSFPAIYQKYKIPIFATQVSFDYAHFLIKDSLKIARLKQRTLPFSEKTMEKSKNFQIPINYKQELQTKTTSTEIMNAGHIPGACMFLISTEKHRILYTGDFKSEDTRLVKGADTNIKDIDILIMENTYSSRDHPNRKENEKRFFELVNSTIQNNGVSIIPSFAVGRAAEVLMILNSFKSDFPIYLDGMAKQAIEIEQKYSKFIKNPAELNNAIKRVSFIKNDEERKTIIKKPCAIITTGGCIDGGPAVYYIRSLYTRPECSLIFTGFQIPRTTGRYLQDTGRFVNEGIDLKVKMNTQFVDFSAHAGRTELISLVKKIRPKAVICIHGEQCERFATELRSRFGIQSYAPKNGDTIEM